MTAISVHLVGAHFRPPAKAILAVLPAGAYLILEPEPSNPYDENAIQVLVTPAEIPASQHENLELQAMGMGFNLDDILAAPSWHLGYVARTEAATLIGPLNEHGYTSAKLGFNAEGKPKVLISMPTSPEEAVSKHLANLGDSSQ